MNEANFGGEWIFAFLIIALMFGGNGFGYNGGGSVWESNNAQTSQLNDQQILVSSANSNYETARLIDNQTMAMMNNNNTNLVNAIQGFNSVNQNMANGFAQLSQQLADLGFRTQDCCCQIKTMLLENRLQDTQIALQNAQNVAVNDAQTQYILSQLGNFVPKTAATA